MTASHITSICDRSLLKWQVLQICKGLHDACKGETTGVFQIACTDKALSSSEHTKGIALYVCE